MEFVAYLWGIETTATYPVETYGTCEFVAYLWGIETWSGRKDSDRVRTFVAYLWGIETHDIQVYCLSSYIVCSLPMRNWNTASNARDWAWDKFVAYLWGIETVLVAVSSLPLVWFVAYLWGIETKSPISNPAFMASVCSLPMRNWNWHCLQSLRNSSWVCSLPMRNWNEGTSLVFPIASISL